MKKSNINLSRVLAILVAVAILVVGLILAVNYLQQTSNESDQATETNQSLTAEPAENIEFTASPEGSVLDQLQAINDDVVVVESEEGSYVDSINGLAGGADGKYWSLYVDGEMATIGAADYMPKGGEVIEWKFQRL